MCQTALNLTEPCPRASTPAVGLHVAAPPSGATGPRRPAARRGHTRLFVKSVLGWSALLPGELQFRQSQPPRRCGRRFELVALVEAPGIESVPGQRHDTKEHRNGAIGIEGDPGNAPTSAPKCAIARHVGTESSELSLAGSERTAALAELFLRACAIGAPCDDLAVALANAVVDAAGVRLALEVLAGGELRFARATELAERVLESVRHAAKAKGSAHG
jgi:hypothetical protein